MRPTIDWTLEQVNQIALFLSWAFFKILSTAGGRQSGDSTGDNQLASLIAVVRSANENKC